MMPGHKPLTSHDLDKHVENQRAKAVDMMVVCPKCNGRGAVGGLHWTHICNLCRGDGEVTPEQADKRRRNRE